MKKEKNKPSVIHEHDKFFREIMNDKRVARDFVKAHLPPEVLAVIDLNHLELQPRVLADETRRETAVDVLFKTKISGRDAYLFILAEHQSVPDALMPFRIIHYTCKIIARHLRQEESAGRRADLLPLVLPIVFYNGRREWRYSRDIRDIVDAPRELVDRYFLQPFQLLDLTQIEDEVLRRHVWVGVAEVIMKHIFESDILPHIRGLADLLRELDRVGAREYVQILLQYTFSKGEVTDDDAFFDLIRTQISPEIEESVMSLAKKFQQKGRQEGRQEGIKETAISMLMDGADPQFVAKHTRLTLEELIEMSKNNPINDENH